jgi:hypothetical protein
MTHPEFMDGSCLYLYVILLQDDVAGWWLSLGLSSLQIQRQQLLQFVGLISRFVGLTSEFLGLTLDFLGLISKFVAETGK